MKWILALVVVVAMASKMAEACCLPNKVKADFFFMMNGSQVGPGGNETQMEISGMGKFALNFDDQLFAFQVGPIIMKQGQVQMPVLTSAKIAMNLDAGTVMMTSVSPMGPSQCITAKARGQLDEEYQCMPEKNHDFMEVLKTDEMTMYQMQLGNVNAQLMMDGQCVPKILTETISFPSGKGGVSIQLVVDNVSFDVDESDFQRPQCDNPQSYPQTIVIPPAKQTIRMMSSGMFAENAMRRR